MALVQQIQKNLQQVQTINNTIVSNVIQIMNNVKTIVSVVLNVSSTVSSFTDSNLKTYGANIYPDFAQAALSAINISSKAQSFFNNSNVAVLSVLKNYNNALNNSQMALNNIITAGNYINLNKNQLINANNTVTSIQNLLQNVQNLVSQSQNLLNQTVTGYATFLSEFIFLFFYKAKFF